MELSKQGYLELASREGLALTPYLDSVGVKTVGFGSTVSDIKDLPLWAWNREISIEEAVSIYKSGLNKYVTGVNKALTLLDIPQHKFDALVSVCYNIGVAGTAKSTFMKLVNAKASDDEIVDAIMLWNKPHAIIGRRTKEANLFKNGVYTNDGACDLIRVDTNHHPHYDRRIDIAEYF